MPQVRLAYLYLPGTVVSMLATRSSVSSPRRRGRRGVALVTMTIAMSAAASIVLVLVSLSLSDLRSTAATEDVETARSIASDAISQYTSELALEPNYYLEQVHPLERARVCQNEPSAPVIQPGALWPSGCGSTWTYTDPTEAATTRLEVTPPSPGARQLTITAVGTSGTTVAAKQVSLVQPSAAAWTAWSAANLDLGDVERAATALQEPTPVFTEDFERGAAGANLSTANTNFDTLSGTAPSAFTFSADQKVSGSLSGRALRTPTPAPFGYQLGYKDLSPTRPDLYTRAYVYIPSWPTGTRIMQINNAAGNAAGIQTATTGGTRLQLNQGTTYIASGPAVSVVTGQWMRLDWEVHTNGTQRLRVFWGDSLNSTDPSSANSDTGLVQAAAGPYTRFHAGGFSGGSAGPDFYLDDIDVYDQDPAPPALPQTVGQVEGLSVYTAGDLVVPAGIEPTGSLLVAEGTVTGEVPLGSRSYSGISGTAREVVPTPVAVGQLAVSAETNRQAACRAQAGRNTPVNGLQMLSQLCLRAGATIENTDSVPVVVPLDAQAYLLVTEVVDGRTRVRIYSSSTAPTPPSTGSADLRAASVPSVANLTHPGVTEAATGTVGLWRPMGIFHPPATGAIATDQDVYLGACGPNLAVTVPGASCATRPGSVAPGMAVTEPFTVIAGSAATPRDVYIGSSIHDQGGLLGAVAFGSIEVPYWSRTYAGSLELDATLLALGPAGIRQFPAMISSTGSNISGSLVITGSVAAPDLDLGQANMGQFRQVEVLPVNPARIPPAFPATARAWKQVQQRPVAPTDACGDPSCDDFLGGGAGSGGDDEPPAAPGPVTAAPGDSSATLTFAPVPDAASYRALYRRDIGAELVVDLQAASCTASCSIQLAGLANGTGYSAQVVAVDAAGNASTRSPAVMFTPDTVPYAPSTLTASVQGHGQVRLAWPQASAWLEGFESGNEPTALATSNSSMSSVTGTGSSTWMSFADVGAPQVGGTRSLLVAAPANSTTTRTAQRVLPPAPQSRVSFYLRPNAFPASGDVDVANVYSPGFDQLVAGLYLTSTGRIGVKSPTGGTTALQPVSAAGQVTNGNWLRVDWDLLDTGSQTVRLYQGAALHSTSTQDAFATLTTASSPERAGRLELGRINGTQQAVNWNIDNITYTTSTAYTSSGSAASGPLPTGYRVYRDNVLIAQTVGEEFIDRSVSPATTHSYVVRALNASGQSQPSPAATVLTLPDRPAAVAATGASQAVSLGWTPPAGTVTGYRVYRSTASAFPGAGGLVATLGSVSSYSDTGLGVGVTYNYWLVAFNASGEGPRATAAATTVPSGPTITDVGPDGTSSLRLDWTSSPGATSYEVERVTPYVTHTFTSAGTFQVTSGSGSVDHLVVAGGGGGGGIIGGGGGGGGVLTGTTSVSPGSYAVTVGTGGTGGTGWDTTTQQGARGGNSTFGALTAQGGGGGGAHGGTATCLAATANGGSGGGGANLTAAGCTGTGTVGQGSSGGAATGNQNAGSGGGGASAAGAAATTVATTFTAGNGGAGASSSITGSAQTYGAGGSGGVRTAATCGGAPVICTGVPGTGTGGSGFGSTLQIEELASSARAGTGAGGGGGGYWRSTSSNSGGDGASGIVVVRYLASSNITATGGAKSAPGVAGATGLTATTWSDTTLTPTPEARYKVRACNAAGCSVWSAEATATAPTTAPSASATTSGLSATLSWAAQARTSHYEIERNNAVSVSSHTGVSITQTDLPAGYTHRYRVRACNVLGCGPSSGYAAALVQPGVPSNLAFTNATTSALTYAWDLAIGASSYGVQQPGFAETVLAGQTNVSRTSSSLAAATSYSYQVRACNAAGCSAYTSPAQNTTGGSVLFSSTPTASEANRQSTTAEGSWVVPPGVKSIAVYTRGAPGTAGTDCAGTPVSAAGLGARAQAVFTTTPGQTLTWVAGKRGMTWFGGYPAASGGDPIIGCANQGVAGGGGSQLRTAAAGAVGGFQSGTDLLTAGGGASGGSRTTTAPGSVNGGAGGSGGTTGGAGGSAIGGFGIGGYGGGGGGGGNAGAAGGAFGAGDYVGNPAEASFFGAWGGGGGGGNAGGGASGYGGGGGGGGVYHSVLLGGWGGGGGGGGSRVVGGTSSSITSAENSGNGQVCIAWHTNTACGPTPPFVP
jgi:hypothetical protein